VKRIFLWAALALLIDQIAKYYILWGVNLPRIGTVEVLPPILKFRMAWNRGVNFGLFANDAEVMRWLLAGLAIAIALWLVWWARNLPGQWGQRFAGLVVGGALGNAADRIFSGAVVDFLNVSCCGLNNPYAFNFADVAIFIGAFGLVLISNKLDKNR